MEKLATFAWAALKAAIIGTCVLLAVAFSIHVYEDSNVLFWLICLGLGAWAAVSLFRFVFRFETWRGKVYAMGGAYLWAVFVALILSGFAHHLAMVWSVELGSGARQYVTAFPDVLGYVRRFLDDLLFALSGLRLAEPEPVSAPAVSASALGGVVEWLVASIWSLVLGVVSSAIFAVAQPPRSGLSAR